MLPVTRIQLWQKSSDLNQIDEDVEADGLELPRSGVFWGVGMQPSSWRGTGVETSQQILRTDQYPASRQDAWLLFRATRVAGTRTSGR